MDVMIKPLVWEHHPLGCIAAPPTGRAYIIDIRVKNRVFFIKGMEPPPKVDTLTAAQLAAHDDYAARITAALEPAWLARQAHLETDLANTLAANAALVARIAQLEAVVAAGDRLAEAVLEVRASKQAWADRDKTEMFGPSGGFSILNRVDAAQESLTAALTTFRAAKETANG